MQRRDIPRATHAPYPSSIAPMAERIDEVCIDRPIDGERRPRETDRAIAMLAELQHGVVARRQLLTMDVSREEIDGRVKCGRLHVIHRGVYAVGHVALSTDGRWTAAVLACGPSAVLSHRSAGQAWRLTPSMNLPIEITRPGKSRKRAGIRAYRSIVPVDERATVDRIPMTSVSRTLFDLAAILTKRQLERALNEAEVLRLSDRLSLPDLLERYPRRRGNAVVRALLRDGTRSRGITRSRLERRLLAILEGTNLPLPRLNTHVHVRGRFFEADCLWAEQQLIVELDGRESHGTEMAFEEDRERDRLLLTEGWRVTRITWRQLCDDAPAVLEDLRRLLRR